MKNKATWLVILAILLGFSLRLWLPKFGYNYDYVSFNLVADLVRRGENVYAATARYNYGPVWSILLKYFSLLASGLAKVFSVEAQSIFRYILPFFLSLVDLGIMAILWKKFGKVVAVIFFLNPVSIFISGYHNQFDNLALLIGFVAMLIYTPQEDKHSKKNLLSLVLLGLSLTTKHLFFIFPVWLALKEKRWFNRALVIFLPVAIFFLSFVPYLGADLQAITDNVFLYQSSKNHVFYLWFVPRIVQMFVSSRLTWLGLLLLFGVLYRKKNPFDSMLVYLMVLVIASPALSNQYLSIPMAFIAVNFNPFFVIYMLYAVFHFMIDVYGLNVNIETVSFVLERGRSYSILIFLLLVGFGWHYYGEQIKTSLNALVVRTFRGSNQ